MNIINPFSDEGIANYEQFKIYPYIIVNAMETIQNKINLDLKQIASGGYFGERILLIGSRGIGKTSALFFIKDMLDKSGVNNYVFSHLVQDAEHFKVFTNEMLEEVTKDPVYLLIDFPDSLEQENYKRFLLFLWHLMTHKNYNKINLIFALNHSHYDKSFDYSEVLGKFTRLRLEQFNLENTRRLIQSRLDLIGIKIEDFIGPNVIDLIYSHTDGIPRNTISACSLLFTKWQQGCPVQYDIANTLMKEKYFDQILNDRVEDRGIRETYRIMIEILKKDFLGMCQSKMDYIEKIKIQTGMGHSASVKGVNNLIKFGIITEKRGGDKRLCRILSLG